MSALTSEQLKALQEIDSPTICNAIERFKVRDDTTGFTGMLTRCLFPHFGTTLGFALTVTVDSTTPVIKRDNQVWIQWVRAMEAAPKPIFLVFKDVSASPERSAHMGEVMSTLAQRLGVVGLLTDGGVRDVLEVERLGLQYFTRGVVVSHGNPRLLEVNVPVSVDGLRVMPGDLLHGDLNGVTSVPLEIAAQVPEMVARIRMEETSLMDYIKGSDFSTEGFIQKKFTH